MASTAEAGMSAGSNLVSGAGTAVATFTLPASPLYRVESVVAHVDNTAGGDTTATLTYADTNGEVIARRDSGGAARRARLTGVKRPIGGGPAGRHGIDRRRRSRASTTRASTCRVDATPLIHPAVAVPTPNAIPRIRASATLARHATVTVTIAMAAGDTADARGTFISHAAIPCRRHSRQRRCSGRSFPRWP
jgi:hypothetical protein